MNPYADFLYPYLLPIVNWRLRSMKPSTLLVCIAIGLGVACKSPTGPRPIQDTEDWPPLGWRGSVTFARHVVLDVTDETAVLFGRVNWHRAVEDDHTLLTPLVPQSVLYHVVPGSLNVSYLPIKTRLPFPCGENNPHSFAPSITLDTFDGALWLAPDNTYHGELRLYRKFRLDVSCLIEVFSINGIAYDNPVNLTIAGSVTTNLHLSGNMAPTDWASVYPRMVRRASYIADELSGSWDFAPVFH